MLGDGERAFYWGTEDVLGLGIAAEDAGLDGGRAVVEDDERHAR